MDNLERMAKLASETPPGCFVEVGVYQGGSARYLYDVAQEQGRHIYLYDTFAGMPCKDDIDSHQVGDFENCDAEQVSLRLPRAFVRQGVFPKSALQMEPVAFVHLDVDQYKSYKEAIEHLKPLMVTGGIMWFDDYGCLEGATKAVNEAFDKVEFVEQKAFVRF